MTKDSGHVELVLKVDKGILPVFWPYFAHHADFENVLCPAPQPVRIDTCVAISQHGGDIVATAVPYFHVKNQTQPHEKDKRQHNGHRYQDKSQLTPNASKNAALGLYAKATLDVAFISLTQNARAPAAVHSAPSSVSWGSNPTQSRESIFFARDASLSKKENSLLSCPSGTDEDENVAIVSEILVGALLRDCCRRQRAGSEKESFIWRRYSSKRD